MFFLNLKANFMKAGSWNTDVLQQNSICCPWKNASQLSWLKKLLMNNWMDWGNSNSLRMCTWLDYSIPYYPSNNERRWKNKRKRRTWRRKRNNTGLQNAVWNIIFWKISVPILKIIISTIPTSKNFSKDISRLKMEI